MEEPNFKKSAYIETETKPFSYWKPLYNFVQKLYITIKVMDISLKNIVSGNLYFRFTVSSLVLQTYSFLRSNIGSILK